MLRVAELARQITRIEGGDLQQRSQSALAGLLHDIGMMVLLENEADRYQPLWQQSGGEESGLTQFEQETFGFTHGELGALILMLWSVPDEVIDAVAYSHASSEIFGSGPDSLPLPSRSVLAAEWLMDSPHPNDTDDIPSALAGTSAASVASWCEARDQIDTLPV